MNVTSKVEKTIVVKVVNSGGNKYQFDGVTTPIISIKRKHLYVFDQSDSSNVNVDQAGSHPMYFSDIRDGKHSIEIGEQYGKEYRHGVSYWLDGVRQHDIEAYKAGFPTATTREVKLLIHDDAPYNLYPVCVNHSNMYGTTGKMRIASESSNTGIALDGLMEALDGKIDTAIASELPALAKSLETIEDTINPDENHVQLPFEEYGDQGPEKPWMERSAEFIIWGSSHHHSHDGGGSQILDNNLDAWNQTSYLGWCCWHGAGDDAQWVAHQWTTQPICYFGNDHCYLRTDYHNCGCYHWINSTSTSGELGNNGIKISESGSPGTYYSHETIHKSFLNQTVQSWEVRDNRVYVQQTMGNAAQLKLRNRFMTGGTGDQPISIKNIPKGGFSGSSSFNRKRHEVVLIQRTSLKVDNDGSNDSWTYNSSNYEAQQQNDWADSRMGLGMGQAFSVHRVKFYPSVPEINLSTNLGKVLQDDLSYNMFFNWTVGDGWQSSNKCVLVDNGDVVLVSGVSYDGYFQSRLKRTDNDRAIQFHHEGIQQCYSCIATNISEHNGWRHDYARSSGVRIVQSRNKRNVVCYGPYYRYGAGCSGWIVSRDSGKAFGDIIYNRSYQHGVQIVPFRDADFYYNLSSDHNDLSGEAPSPCGILYQNGRGEFDKHMTGPILDNQSNTTNYSIAVRMDDDGYTY